MLAERLGPEGGTERYLDIILPALRASGDRVEVIARSVTSSDPAAIECPWSDEHEPGDRRAAHFVSERIARTCPDVVVLQNVMDATVVRGAVQAAPRSVYQIHDHRPFCPNGDRVYPRTGRACTAAMGAACLVHALVDGCMYGPRSRSYALVKRRESLRDAIALSHLVIANSPFVAKLAQRNGITDAASVPLPLSDDAYADAPAPGPRALLFVGRVQPQKGLRSLVRALSLIGQTRRPPLRVVGDGPDIRAAIADAARRSVTLELLGRRDARGVRNAIDDAGAVVLPSLWDEPFGYVGIESFARGRPVIAYDVGGVSWWLRDGVNGALVPRGDERALAMTIERVLDDASSVGRVARTDAEAYRLSPIIGRLRELYKG